MVLSPSPISQQNTPPSSETTKRQEAAKNFEAYMMHTLLRVMWEGISTDGPLGGGFSEQVFRDMMLEHYAPKILPSRGLGVYQHLSRTMNGV